MKQPWFKFYTGDWLKDPQLSLCTPATRGVWIDLLSAMHEAGRVGSLSGTIEQLSRLARCVPADLALALTDMQTTGAAIVTERNGVVTVLSRRLEREAKAREANALRQAKYRSNGVDDGHVTPLSPLSDSLTSDFLNSEFLDALPEILNTEAFCDCVRDWLRYKHERKECYAPVGWKKMLARAAKLAQQHGVAHVIEAMNLAMANNWRGWDHSFSQAAQPAKPAERRRAIKRIFDDDTEGL